MIDRGAGPRSKASSGFAPDYRGERSVGHHAIRRMGHHARELSSLEFIATSRNPHIRRSAPLRSLQRDRSGQKIGEKNRLNAGPDPSRIPAGRGKVLAGPRRSISTGIADLR